MVANFPQKRIDTPMHGINGLEKKIGRYKMFAKPSELVRPNPIRFFGFNSILGPMFVFKRVGLALRNQKTGPIGSG